MEKQAMPFDALDKSKGKRVVIEMKGGKQYVGVLSAWDPHINVVLADAEERENNEVKRKVGTVFIRGDTITLIFPD